MFVALSKFIVTNDMTAKVKQAFVERPHLVDDAPAEAITARQYKLQPELASRYGETGRAKCLNELVTLQRELIKKNVELEKLNEQKDQFIGMAAHDLRNPLQVIGAICHLLSSQRRGKLTEDQIRFVSVIKKNVDFMVKLINDLLYVSKIESGRLHLELQPTDLVSLVRKNIELNRLLAEQKQIEIEFDHDESIPEIMMDPSKFEQVLNNLLSNATKFSYPQTTIEVSLVKKRMVC